MGLLGQHTEICTAGKQNVFHATGRYGSIMKTEGISGHQPHAWRVCASGHRNTPRMYGVTAKDFALVAEKNHAHSSLNPLSQYRERLLVEEILSSGDDLLSEH